MPGCGAKRDWVTWWAGPLSLALALIAGGGLGAQQSLPADPVGSPEASVAPTPAAGDIASGLGGSLNEAFTGVHARLDELSRLAGKVRGRLDDLAALKQRNQRSLARIEVLESDRDRLLAALKHANEKVKARDEVSAQIRSLAEVLSDQRRENVRLRSDLAEAERARIEQAARAKEAALSGRMSGLGDELARSEAQLAEAGAARAAAEARLEEQARTAAADRARADRQLAAMADQLRERDRELEQMASARSENADLQQRLDAAETELERKGAENDRLAEQLAALRMAAAFATVMAQDNLAAIEDQITVLHAAAVRVPPEDDASHLTSDTSDSPAAPLAAALVDVLPPMPHPKPPQPQASGAGWAPVSATAEEDARTGAEALAELEDGWIPADLLDAAVSRWEPTTMGALAAAPDGPEALAIMPAAAPALEPPPSPGLLPDENAAIDALERDDRWDLQETAALPGETAAIDALELGDQWDLQETAALLADILRATRAQAVSQSEERVFTLDVAERAFAAGSAQMPVLLDPAIEIQLLTAKSELVGEGGGRIRFFPDGSSTGGRIDLELLGERAAINVRWSNGLVTVEP